MTICKRRNTSTSIMPATFLVVVNRDWVFFSTLISNLHKMGTKIAASAAEINRAAE